MTIKEQTLYYLLQEQGYGHGATVTAMQILTQSREAMDDAIVFVEDGIKTAGISEELALILFENGITSFRIKAFPEKFISNGTRAHVLKEAGLSSECLVEEALSCLENKKKVKND